MKNTMETNLFLSNPLLKEHQHTMMEELGNNNDCLTKNFYSKIVFFMCKSLAPFEIRHVFIMPVFIGYKFETFM